MKLYIVFISMQAYFCCIQSTLSSSQRTHKSVCEREQAKENLFILLQIVIGTLYSMKKPTRHFTNTVFKYFNICYVKLCCKYLNT